jgi:hypothetical protein
MSTQPTRFVGTDSYIATPDLMVAVNAADHPGAAAAGQGRARHRQDHPGAGDRKRAGPAADRLAHQVDHQGAAGPLRVRRGRAPARRRSSATSACTTSRNYIKRGKLWDAFPRIPAPVLLIDEIDKADIEFPNDLLLELDRMEFYVYETGETVAARNRPIVIITSNNEKELPDAFLRRCFFHYIRFPDRETMERIVDVHYPDLLKRRWCGRR